MEARKLIKVVAGVARSWRRGFGAAATVLAALVVVAPASALTAQIGDPQSNFAYVRFFLNYWSITPEIGERVLWVIEPQRKDGLVEESHLLVRPKPDGTPGALLEECLDYNCSTRYRNVGPRLVPGLPLLLANCGRVPFTSDFKLTCDGAITSAIVDLGPGDDWLSYGLRVPGILNGGSGADDITGGPVGDLVVGSEGGDILDGGGGNDAVFGEVGNDVVRGGDGNDTVNGGSEDDLLDGGSGADVLNGGDGKDVLAGGDGDDVIGGAAGDDSLDGGGGADVLNGGFGSDSIAGGAGIDTLDYGSRSIGVTVSWDGVANDGQPGEGDLVRSDLENVIGGVGNDVLGGSLSANRLTGGGGDDALSGGAALDWLLGGAGNDVLDGGSGDDRLNGDGGNDVLRGGFGSDRLNGGSGDDSLNGGIGGDVLNGDDGDDVIDARDGFVDNISCGTGVDEVQADPGDTVTADCERIIRSR